MHKGYVRITTFVHLKIDVVKKMRQDALSVEGRKRGVV